MPSRLSKPHASIKRTVSLHPQLDQAVRKLQAVMIENGWKANYSYALNTVLVVYFFDVVKFRNKDPRNLELIRLVKGFLGGLPIGREEAEGFNAALEEIGRQYRLNGNF